MPKTKVDLTLLKRLVAELEGAVVAMDKATAEGVAATATTSTPNVEVVIEAAKAAGLAAGVMQEAGLLIMDIQTATQGGSLPKGKGDLLSQILGGLKTPGSSN